MGLSPLLAVDIGNSRIKLGLFDGPQISALPEPKSILCVPTRGWDRAVVAQWLEANGGSGLDCWIASVNRAASGELMEWIRTRDPSAPVNLLQHRQMPLSIEVEHPERVGMDRLAGAVAGNRLRHSDRPAVVVDVGTAVKVNLLSVAGVFLGGAILPGIGMSARALHEFTDLLPLVPTSELDAPPSALGKSTAAAIRSGLYWGAVGAVRELTGQLRDDTAIDPEVFLTGGDAPIIAQALTGAARHEPQLVLAGIALTVAALHSPA